MRSVVTPVRLRRRTAAPPNHKENSHASLPHPRRRHAAAVGFSGALVASTISPAGAAGAAGEPAIGTQVLNMLCTSKAGSPVFTPMTISRCQDARPRDGFGIEELICEGLLEGTFESVTSASRPSRVNWFCFHGPPTP